jgi:hypothetical protein
MNQLGPVSLVHGPAALGKPLQRFDLVGFQSLNVSFNGNDGGTFVRGGSENRRGDASGRFRLSGRLYLM